MRKNQRNIEDAHATREEQHGRDCLHGKLQIGAGSDKIVVNAETKNEAGWHINAEKSCREYPDSDSKSWENKR